MSKVNHVFYIKCPCGNQFLCKSSDIVKKEKNLKNAGYKYGEILCPKCGVINIATSENMVYDSHPLYGGITQYGKEIKYK